MKATVIISQPPLNVGEENDNGVVLTAMVAFASVLRGSDGKSAYQIWLDAGNSGTEEDFLASLVGPAGQNGRNGTDGTNGTNGTNGADGKSAYQIWLEAGNSGNEAAFLASLKGQDGRDGQNGTNGTNGTNGADGKSAYQIWLDAGNSGTEADFLASLIGPQGPAGSGGLSNHDFTHTANTTVSTSTTVTFAANTRCSRMVSASADLSVAFAVNNSSDNYLWIKNTGSSDIDIAINSVTHNSTSVSNVYVPDDGITVPAGKVCEIGIVCNADGAFITSRSDLSL